MECVVSGDFPSVIRRIGCMMIMELERVTREVNQQP